MLRRKLLSFGFARNCWEMGPGKRVPTCLGLRLHLSLLIWKLLEHNRHLIPVVHCARGQVLGNPEIAPTTPSSLVSRSRRERGMEKERDMYVLTKIMTALAAYELHSQKLNGVRRGSKRRRTPKDPNVLKLNAMNMPSGWTGDFLVHWRQCWATSNRAHSSQRTGLCLLTLLPQCHLTKWHASGNQELLWKKDTR